MSLILEAGLSKATHKNNNNWDFYCHPFLWMHITLGMFVICVWIQGTKSDQIEIRECAVLGSRRRVGWDKPPPELVLPNKRLKPTENMTTFEVCFERLDPTSRGHFCQFNFYASKVTFHCKKNRSRIFLLVCQYGRNKRISSDFRLENIDPRFFRPLQGRDVVTYKTLIECLAWWGSWSGKMWEDQRCGNVSCISMHILPCIAS